MFGLGMTAASGLRAEEFTPPGPADFDLPPVGGGFGTFELFGQEWVIGVTKPMLQLVLGAILVFGFLVPRRQAAQPGARAGSSSPARAPTASCATRWAATSSAATTSCGSCPTWSSLFFFILVNNLFASIPFFQFPTFSRAGMVYGLAAAELGDLQLRSGSRSTASWAT